MTAVENGRANVDGKILERIRKCLALSRSAGEGEAAAALEAARRLMDRHGVTEEALSLAEVGEARTGSPARVRPNGWEVDLVLAVAGAFGCKTLFETTAGRPGRWVFIGRGEAAPVAAYAFAVLFRRLKAARREHVAGLRRYGAKRKTLCGDLYCQAWVNAVEERVKAFAGGGAEDAVITLYVNKKFRVGKAAEARNRDFAKLDVRDFESYHAGKYDGDAVRLQHGVHGSGEEQALLG